MELLEYICSFLVPSDLKPWLLVNKDMNTLVKKMMQRRIPDIQWKYLKNACFIPFQFPVETNSLVRFLNGRYLLSTKMMCCALEPNEGESRIGKHMVSIWSFTDNCYVLNETYASCQFIFSFINNLCIIYNKSSSDQTICNIYSFYKNDSAAYYSFVVNKSDLAVLEAPSVSFSSFISPNGKYLYSFSKHAILSHTGKVLPLSSSRKFVSNIAKSSQYSWIENNTFRIDGSEFQCNTHLKVKIQNDCLQGL